MQVTTRSLDAHSRPDLPARRWTWSRLTPAAQDRCALALLTLGYGLLVLLLTPQRDFVVLDDWTYAQGVRHWQLSGAPTLSDWALPSFVAQAWWGSVFATLFGYSLTTLTWATLVLSWLGVVCFYGLLRALDLRPAPALFGAALLFLNPVYLHLSYSFMTDTVFVALLIATLLAAVRGIKADNDRLLLIAMLLAGLLTLVRQIGILPAGALGVYLLATRRLTGRRLAILAVPLLTLGAYFLWHQTQPTPAALAWYSAPLGPDRYGTPSGLLRLGGLLLIRQLRTLPALGLWLLPLGLGVWRGRLPRRAALFAAWVGGLMVLIYLWQYGPAVRTPLDSIDMEVSSSGFLIPAANDVLPPPILTPAVWLVVSLAMIAITSRLLGGLPAALAGRGRALWGHLATARPIDFVYLTGAGCGLTGIFTLSIYDRYLLPLFPFLVILLLRRVAAGGWGRRGALVAGGALAILSLCTLLAQADFADRAAARWAAGNAILARGVPPTALAFGIEWNGWHGYDAVGARLPGWERLFGYDPTPPAWTVDESPVPGYHEAGRIPYFSRLGGFTWRAALLLERDPPAVGR